jgi:hypothetical protein
MGHRALIVFTDNKEEQFSPTVYLHWHGAHAIEWLRELQDLMSDRLGDIDYACARFIGICHQNIEGNLSLGVWTTPFDAPAWDAEDWAEYSHGDEGVFLVNTTDFSIRNVNLGDKEWRTSTREVFV